MTQVLVENLAMIFHLWEIALTTNDDIIVCDEIEELNRIEIDKVKQMKWCNKTLKTYIQSMAKFFVWLRSVKPHFQEMWNDKNKYMKNL
jgi:hypothetical protein